MWTWRGLLAAASIALMGAAESPQPTCAPKDATTLKVDEVRTVCICARPRWNHTGIRLEHGGKYLITARGIWWDADYRHGPGGGDSPNFKFSFFERFRRMKKANWFELICALDSQESSRFRVGCKTTVCAPDSQTSAELPVGCRTKLDKLEKPKELTCYANDVFYSNNSGAIEMTVKRTE